LNKAVGLAQGFFWVRAQARLLFFFEIFQSHAPILFHRLQHFLFLQFIWVTCKIIYHRFFMKSIKPFNQIGI